MVKFKQLLVVTFGSILTAVQGYSNNAFPYAFPNYRHKKMFMNALSQKYDTTNNDIDKLTLVNNFLDQSEKERFLNELLTNDLETFAQYTKNVEAGKSNNLATVRRSDPAISVAEMAEELPDLNSRSEKLEPIKNEAKPVNYENDPNNWPSYKITDLASGMARKRAAVRYFNVKKRAPVNYFYLRKRDPVNYMYLRKKNLSPVALSLLQQTRMQHLMDENEVKRSFGDNHHIVCFFIAAKRGP